jgi:hypothetical protein
MLENHILKDSSFNDLAFNYSIFDPYSNRSESEDIDL